MSFSYNNFNLHGGIITDTRPIHNMNQSLHSPFFYGSQHEFPTITNHETSEYDGITFESINEHAIFEYPNMDGRLFTQLQEKYKLVQLRNGKYLCLKESDFSELVDDIKKYEKEIAKYDIGGVKFLEAKDNIELYK